jgi:hypothetical protein
MDAEPIKERRRAAEATGAAALKVRVRAGRDPARAVAPAHARICLPPFSRGHAFHDPTSSAGDLGPAHPVCRDELRNFNSARRGP